MRIHTPEFSAACCTAFAIVLAGSGCDRRSAVAPSGQTTTPERTAQATSSNTEGRRSSAPAEEKKDGATISVTSVEYYKEYAVDKDAMKKKYQDATIDVSGTIVGVNYAGTGMIMLESEKDKKYPWVVCLMPDETEPWARYVPGQTIKLRGMYPKVDTSFATVIRCVVLDAGPNPAIAMTAEKFADELSDPKAVREKYEDKYFYLSGEVDAVEKKMGGGGTVFLKGNGRNRVPLMFGPLDGRKEDKYKVGSKVNVFAHFGGENFYDCELITK